MPEDNSIRRRYNIETDAADWPKGLSEQDKSVLTQHAKEVMEMYGPQPLRFIYDQMSAKPASPLRNAQLWDWLNGATHRAIRQADGWEHYALEKRRIGKAQARNALLGLLVKEGLLNEQWPHTPKEGVPDFDVLDALAVPGKFAVQIDGDVLKHGKKPIHFEYTEAGLVEMGYALAQWVVRWRMDNKR